MKALLYSLLIFLPRYQMFLYSAYPKTFVKKQGEPLFSDVL